MSANPPIALSIIVPAYNEAATIVATLTKIRDFLDTRGESYEVIVSADGDDGTREAAMKFAPSVARAARPCDSENHGRTARATEGAAEFRVIGSVQRRGKGVGVREGVLQARGNIVGFVDADYKTPIEEMEKILPRFNEGFDVVIGSRKVSDANIQVLQPLYRRLGSRAFRFAMQSLIGLSGIADTQCGFKFFTCAAAQKLFAVQRIDGYMFDVEVLWLAKSMGYRVGEVGVRWRDDGDSRYQPILGTIRNAKELWRIRSLHVAPPHPLQPATALARKD